MTSSSPKLVSRECDAFEQKDLRGYPLVSWDEIVVTKSRRLPPDPKLMEAIGLNHAFETAIADLVDNSVDAGAQRVLIRFVRDGDKLVALYVVDDGRGMDDDTIDKAMTVGGRRAYKDADLGHFGVGLKAASLGQADSLSVLSRMRGHKAVGRRWLIHRATSGFECDVIDSGFATQEIERHWEFLALTTGTVVRWDGVKTFPSSKRPDVIERFLEDTVVRVRQHLGLVFHRFLETGRMVIGVDVEDLTVGETGPPFLVEPIDPFGYLRAGRVGYPQALTARLGEQSLKLHCYIWPGRSQLPGFRLPGGPPESRQGFYFYRNDRLLQTGGWNGVVHPERHLQLARVAVNIDDSMAEMFVMNPEKTRVEARASFTAAVEASRGGGSGFTFSGFLQDATETFKQSRKRTTARPRVIPPGRGLAPKIRSAISNELGFLPGEEPIDVRWTEFSDDSFFDIDREEHVIWLNRAYRWAVIGERDATLNDAPLVKALLYLLLEDLFRGAYLGAKDKDNIELWQSILTAAARSELE
jgi:hypothetical protein